MPLPYKKEKGSLAPSTIIGLMNTKTKIFATISTTLLLVGFAGPANAATKTEAPRVIEAVERTYQPAVASSVTTLNFERPTVTSVAAPIPEPEPVAQPTQTVRTQSVAVAPASPTAVKAPTAPQTVSNVTAPVQATSAPVAASGKGAALLASARSQIGQIQDCTAMVERALGSIGIITGDLAPAQFFRFGSVVGTPAPGDILISAGHVGIYSGNGMMVSGGFNGNQTVEHPVSYVGAFTAVRVA